MVDYNSSPSRKWGPVRLNAARIRFNVLEGAENADFVGFFFGWIVGERLDERDSAQVVLGSALRCDMSEMCH